MASLADLFVTYKNVEPVKKEDTEETKESPSESYTRILQELQDLRERVAWLGGAIRSSSSQSGASADDDDPDDDNDPEVPELEVPVSGNSGTLGSNTSSTIGSSSGSGNGSSSVVSHLSDEIANFLKEQGIKARVTSGYDPNRQNKTSKHVTGEAVDIVPTDGDFESLLESLATNEAVRKFFSDHNLGLFDERTNRFGGSDYTGSHLHIQPGKAAVAEWQALVEKYNTVLDGEETEQSGGVSEVEDLSKREKVAVKRMYEMIKFAINNHNNEGFHPFTSEYADKLARWYTAQWATENNFSDKFKLKDYWSSLYLDSLSSDKRINQYINDLVAQNGQLNFGGSLKGFLDNISGGDESYKASFNSALKKINKYLDAVQSNRQGGRFTNIRELYGKSFSQYR